jgi:hypothetical protein
MLLAITGRYRHKKTRKLLIYIVFRVSVGFLKTLLWWDVGNLTYRLTL